MHGRMKKRPGPLAPPESESRFLRKICLRSFFQMLEEIFRESLGQFSFLVHVTFLQATKAENHCSFILLHNLVGGHRSRWWWFIHNADAHRACLFVGHEKWSLFQFAPIRPPQSSVSTTSSTLTSATTLQHTHNDLISRYKERYVYYVSLCVATRKGGTIRYWSNRTKITAIKYHGTKEAI